MPTRAPEAAQIISEQVMRKVKTEGADVAVASEVQHTFLQILDALSFKQLDQKLDDFRVKKAVGPLDSSDFELFEKLRAVHATRKAKIEEDVASVFKFSKEGNVRQAERLAKRLVQEGIDGVPSGTITLDEKKEILGFANQAIRIVKDQHDGNLRYQDHQDELISANNSGEKGARLFEKLGGKLDKPAVQDYLREIRKEVEKQDTKDALSGIAQVKKKIEKATKPFDEKVVNDPDKHELKKRLKATASGREVEEVVTDLLDNGSGTVKGIVDGVAKGSEIGRRELEKYVGDLYKAKKVLEAERLSAALGADHGRKMTKRKVKLEIGGFDLGTIRASASKKERLEHVLKLVGNEQPWSDTEKVDLIAKALNIPLPERPRAEAIWREAKEWEDKYGTFKDKAEGLRWHIENVLHPVANERDYENLERHLYRGGSIKSFRELGVMRPGVVMSGVNDEDTVLSEYGREVQKQMEEFQLRVYVGKDREGNDKFRAETNSEYWARRASEGSIPSNYGMGGRSIELGRLTGGKKYKDFEETEARVVALKVRATIEDMVGRIMASNDSSRAGQNQPLAWEVNDLMSWLDTKDDAGFRDLWQARLATYDQSAVLGSVGKKDAHEQIAGYVPREWLAILFDDHIDFGNYRDASGALKQYKLTSKHVHAMLSERVPGSGIDNNDIWLGRILGAQTLDEAGLAKRRFMAFLLGEQRGVEFEFDSSGNFLIKNTPDNQKRAASEFGGKIENIFREVGLGKDGGFPNETEYREYEKYDLFATKWFFLNQSLTRHRVELTENELERGGDENGWWAQTVNAFRKLHGRSARDYTEEKEMGMPSSRSAVDSYWRSFPAWKLMSKDKDGNYTIIHKLMEGFKEAMPGATKEQKDNFVAMFEHIAYMPERFEIGKLLNTPDTIKHGYGGGLRATADVRHMDSSEWNSITDIFAQGKQTSFDWTPIIKVLMPEAAEAGTLPADLHGTLGLEVFKANYNLNQFMDYGSLMQGFWVDFLSYTGTQAKIWDNMSELVTNLANPQLQTSVIKQIRGFDNGLANAKSVEWLGKLTNETGWDLTGYESLVNAKGEETSKKWRIKDTSTAEGRKELKYAADLGYKVLSNGHVADKNGHYMARPGNVSFFNNFGDLNAKKSLGSPWIGRDFAAVSWEDKRDLVYGYLRTFNISDPKIWRDAHARFNASMYFGAELDPHVAPTMRNVIKELNRHRILGFLPWKYFVLPYTIARGIYTDLPVNWGMLLQGWAPVGKQVGRIFGS